MQSRGPWAVDTRQHGVPHLLTRVLSSFAVGFALGFAARIGDRALADWTGIVVSLGAQRTLLASIVSGLITVTAFALWMRTVMAGMLAGQISTRMLSGHLDDGYQQTVLDTMTAALAVTIACLVTLPSDGPVTVTFSLPLVLVVIVVALAGILIALMRAVQDLSVPHLLIRQIEHGQRILQQRETRQRGMSRDDVDITASGDHVEDIRCDTTGWVTAIDQEAMLRAAPAGVSLVLRTRPGQLVGPGDVLLSSSSELEPRVRQRIRDGVHVGRRRNPDEDIDHLVGQMVDMAAHALTGGSNDTSMADEAMRAVGVLLASLIETGEPVRQYSHHDSHLMDVAALGVRETTRTHVERLRMAASTHPRSAHQFVHVAGTVAAAARTTQREDILDDVGEQVRRMLDAVEDSDLSSADVAELRQTASTHQLP